MKEKGLPIYFKRISSIMRFV